MGDKKPEASLVKTFGKAGGYDVLTRLGEVSLDALMNEGVLRDIPILGTLFGLGRAGLAVRDLLFAKKLQAFLIELENVSDEREKFVLEMDADTEVRDRVGMQLIVLLDRFEEMEKARLLGKAFATYLRGAIEREKFLRMARAIDRCFADDLMIIGTGETLTRAQHDPQLAADYQLCGFIELVALPSIAAIGARPQYKWTKFGQEFYKAIN